MLSSRTTPNDPIIITRDKTEKQMNCVVTAIDIYFCELEIETSSLEGEDIIQS